MDQRIALSGLGAHATFPTWTARATLQVRRPGWRDRAIAWSMARLGLLAAFANALYRLVDWFKDQNFLSF